MTQNLRRPKIWPDLNPNDPKPEIRRPEIRPDPISCIIFLILLLLLCTLIKLTEKYFKVWRFKIQPDSKSDSIRNKTWQKRTWSGPARFETTWNLRLLDIRWPETWPDPNPNDSKPEMTWVHKNLKPDPARCEMTRDLKKPIVFDLKPDPTRDPTNIFDQTYLTRPVRIQIWSDPSDYHLYP
jgi:hypothetical protein